MHDTNHKGNVAEAAIAAAAIKLGVPVMKPLVEHTRYDLIFEVGKRLLRVQCKWAPLRGDVVMVNLVSTRLHEQRTPDPYPIHIRRGGRDSRLLRGAGRVLPHHR
jgi:hypothetical protein